MYPSVESHINIDLTGQVAVVTGAGRGIGRAIAEKLAASGAQVVIAARSGDELDAAAGEMTAAGWSVRPQVVDVTDEKSVCELFETVAGELGRLDIVVNNAGIGIFGPLAEFGADDFDRVIQVNLRGTFLCCREAMRCMIPRSSGYIINISSVVGFKGYVDQSVYTASKHGVMGLTKALALEAREHGVRVSAVLPGGVDTEMIRQSRPDIVADDMMQPSDIAEVAAFLLSLPDRAAIDEIYIRRSASLPF